MGKTVMTVYYREPTILLTGKYCHEITIEHIRKIRDHYIELYGDKIDKIYIDYNFRKKGIGATYKLHSKLQFYFEPRQACLYSHVLYQKTKDHPAKSFYMDDNCIIEDEEE